MIKIGICDDEKIILEILHKLVIRCMKKLKLVGEIVLFNSGEKLLESKVEMDILFLDIEMPQIDGIQVGKRLREQGKDYKIIIATSQIERFKEVFHINAFRFVTKPFEIEEIQDALQDAVFALGGVEKIEVYKERMKYDILQRDILYIEAVESSIEFVLKEGVFRKESSLTELEEILNTEIFYRITRGCIVNMAKIEKYEKGMISIAQIQRKVSQRRKRDFEEKYREYMAWR